MMPLKQNLPCGAAPTPTDVETIYQTIRTDIIRMRLRPGERLSEKELGLRFGTSRTPVREAIVRLVEDGLIEVRPQRGTYVARISLQAVRRARFVRSALELAIIREAAEHGVSEAVLEEAKRAIAGQENARLDPEQFTTADDMFHRTFANGVGYGDIWSVVENQKAQFDRIRFLSLPNVTPVDHLIEQHRMILSAVEARDPDRAENTLREHLSIVVGTATALMRISPDLVLNDV
ncbi:GntR family transcriptional regulator [Microvirga aerophila]|nr:GntR family transcriptional regulator [Microvirga aerophila]